MGQGDNKCAACGQFAGRGHKCPPVATPVENRTMGISHAAEDTHHSETTDRVARGRAHIASGPTSSAPPALAYESVSVDDLAAGDAIDLRDLPEYLKTDNPAWESEFATIADIDNQDYRSVVYLWVAGDRREEPIDLPHGHQVRRLDPSVMICQHCHHPVQLDDNQYEWQHVDGADECPGQSHGDPRYFDPSITYASPANHRYSTECECERCQMDRFESYADGLREYYDDEARARYEPRDISDRI